MKVRYEGPAAEGQDVPHPDPELPGVTEVTHCPRMVWVELPHETAEGLLASGPEWASFAAHQTKAAARKRSRAAKKAPAKKAAAMAASVDGDVGDGSIEAGATGEEG